MENENKFLEYKQDTTKSYLKTVSAFANYNDGCIVFGISDDLFINGINDLKDFKLKIENEINDNITPKPDFLIKENKINNTLTIFIKKGIDVPYLYKGKAYKRNDTSTIEISSYELKRLVLEGMNLNFEDLTSLNQDLSFIYFNNKLQEKLDIHVVNYDIYKTLSLFNKNNKFNNAALLFSDSNSFPGIDIVVFGESINIIKNHYELKNESILKEFDDSINYFNLFYSYEIIDDDFSRKKEYKVPSIAFREALANAIIHRDYDNKVNIKIEMYEDKIIISSKGGLINNMNKESFIEGDYSELRNPIIASIFHRLGYSELLATGIRKIKEAYKKYYESPIFIVHEDSIKYILPVINNIKLNKNEKEVLDSLSSNIYYKRKDIEDLTGLKKENLLLILKDLQNKNLLYKKGNNKDIVYFKK